MIGMLLLAAAAAAAPLFARASEDLFGIAPCELCLWQRWPYWVAAALALGGALLPRARRPLFWLALGAILVSGAIAGFHVGVEQGWWPSPLPGCQAPRSAGGATVDDLMRALAPAPSKPCDAPTYLVPGLPLSMAAMNLLYALGLSGLAAIWMRRGDRP
ncbi:disulfide bond formation protein B [Paeniroseomonas aquatica]|uniref:Disulfide bond formation protein B n=1 Tax=Paeniroseomonas aquatica TaxID=373043 RepID=A0ABT8AB63_9PROT|nr:disulfide bond formation protein B [Paeniroseomonas aquatica]MDN3567052.1 disulfide bond formation protein B [Paeniroseomonas aquatica]